MTLDEILKIKYVPTRKDCRLEVPNTRFDLITLAKTLKVKHSVLKKSYLRGLFILNNLIDAYNIFQQYDSEDIEPYIKENKIELLWKEEAKKYSYIPYIGIEEYALLHKYSPTTLKNLIYKKTRSYLND